MERDKSRKQSLSSSVLRADKDSAAGALPAGCPERQGDVARQSKPRVHVVVCPRRRTGRPGDSLRSSTVGSHVTFRSRIPSHR